MPVPTRSDSTASEALVEPRRPRVLEVDLACLAGAPADRAGVELAMREWRGSRPWLDRVGTWSGGALGLALLHEHALADARTPEPLVISVGECVRRGVPTAARASVASRAPLTGLFGEGLAGGELAARLASIADALVVRGISPISGAVLAIRAGASEGLASVELHEIELLAGRSPRDVDAELRRRFGPCATLSIGIAGEREAPFASLAAGGDVPHFVGRGGLGAVLGRAKLKAIAVIAEPRAPGEERELARRLASSPRLLARAEGGTLELFEAFGAREELFGRAPGEDVAREAREARRRRHGCRGCPTPCGWVFETRAGATDASKEQGARFGASHALGLALGLARFDDALALLADCDELGLDAKETGAVLALACRPEVGLARRGDLARLRELVRDIAAGRGEGARMARGAAAWARELGIETAAAKGASVRRDASLASVLGQCVSSRGGDPMRVFPFFAGDGAELAAWIGIERDALASDPRSPAAKGRLVAWHEDWSNALDTSGFCAFSAAALLADGVTTLDELAREVAPRALLRETAGRGPGAALLDAGAALSVLQRRLNELWGVAAGADRPEWAREALDRPGMWDEYARARGLDRDGRVTKERWAALEGGAPWAPSVRRAREPYGAELAPPSRGKAATRATRRGRVVVRAVGVLRERIGSERELLLDLPATLSEVAAGLAALEPGRGAAEPGGGLFRNDGTLVPAVYRRGQRVGASDLVEDGDVLDLIAVVAGG